VFQNDKKRLEVKAIVIGYAMSRLDTVYLESFGYSTWKDAFEDASRSLGESPSNFKYLRDEFDPFHMNPRKGFRRRNIRPTRQAVLSDMRDVSDEALVALVRSLLLGKNDESMEAIDSLARLTNVTANVAERLLTGRRAEEYFLENSYAILEVEKERLLDLRNAALGYDFGVLHDANKAIEVKGMKSRKGEILFTDREWIEAKKRRCDYRVVVVANLASVPRVLVIANPFENLEIQCRYQKTITANWTTSISV